MTEAFDVLSERLREDTLTLHRVIADGYNAVIIIHAAAVGTSGIV
jgi:hypothetical protein